MLDEDITPPQVAITTPDDGDVLASQPISVQGTIDDPSAQVTVNVIAAAVSAGGFEAAAVPLVEGPNVVTATARDFCGNEAVHAISVELDTIPPQLAATVGKVCSGVVRVSGTTSDLHGPVRVTVEGPSPPAQLVVAADGTFGGSVTVPEGLAEIAIVAADSAGNASRQVFELALVTCSAASQCHNVGVCVPETETCTEPFKSDGVACSDGNACTRVDTCQAGACTGRRSRGLQRPRVHRPRHVRPVHGCVLGAERVRSGGLR